MIKGVTLAHLGPIWYHLEPPDILYLGNQFLALDFFCRFLQQHCSKSYFYFKKHILFTGACEPCTVKITQICACSDPSENVVDCDKSVLESGYSCGKICQMPLACGNHTCLKICHDPRTENCEICPKSPELIKTCFCGKKPLEENLRKVCTDKIPSCGEICGKTLVCGPVGANHTCQEICHDGTCPKCPSTTEV